MMKRKSGLRYSCFQNLESLLLYEAKTSATAGSQISPLLGTEPPAENSQPPTGGLRSEASVIPVPHWHNVKEKLSHNSSQQNMLR